MAIAGQKELVYYAKCGHAVGILLEIYTFTTTLLKPTISLESGKKKYLRAQQSTDMLRFTTTLMKKKNPKHLLKYKQL